jgi:hypothetical protein
MMIKENGNAVQERAISLSLVGATFAVLLSLSTPSLAGETVPCPLAAKAGDTYILPVADVPCSSTAEPSVLFNIGAFGGGAENRFNGGVMADFGVAVGGHFGFQVDGILGLSENTAEFGQIAGHAFINAGDIGLFGIYGSYADYGSGADVTRLGGEVDVALGDMSIAAIFGWQSVGKHNIFIDSTIGYAITSNAKIYTGFAFDNVAYGKLGFEAAFPMEGMLSPSLFGEVRYSSSDDVSGRIGIKMALGLSQADPYCPQPAKARSGQFANHWWLPSASTAALSKPKPKPKPKPPGTGGGVSCAAGDTDGDTVCDSADDFICPAEPGATGDGICDDILSCPGGDANNNNACDASEVRACVLEDVQNFVPELGCSYGVSGSVVGTDTSGCSVGSSACS